MSPRPTLQALALLLAVHVATAQSPTLVLRVGDPVPGAGNVTDVESVAVNHSGACTIRVATDDPVASAALLFGGTVEVKVGDAPPKLGGATVSAIGSATQDLFLINTVVLDLNGGSSQVVAYNLTPQLLTGQPTAPLTSQLPAGTTWSRLDDVQFAPFDPAFLVRGAVHDPTGAGADRSFACMTWQSYPSLLSHVDVFALEGQPAPGLPRVIEEVRGGRWQARVSHNGQMALWSCDLTGSTADDGCVYLASGYPLTQQALLAREGSPSPVPGRAWGPLEDHALDLYQGSWSLRATLDASDPSDDEVLVVDGVVHAREGHVPPALAPFAIESLGAGRGVLDPNGRVLWYARWSDPGTPWDDEALLADDHVLVRTGTTLVGGAPLVDIEDGADAYALDRYSGRWLVFIGTLADGTRGVFRYDQGGMQLYCTSKQSSSGCKPFIGWFGEPPSAAAGSGFFLAGSLILNQVTTVVFYGVDGPAAAPFLGGTLCVSPPLRRLPPQDSGGGSSGGNSCQGKVAVDFNAWIASGADPALVPGQRVHVQYWFRDPGFPPPGDVGLSNGLEFQIGP